MNIVASLRPFVISMAILQCLASTRTDAATITVDGVKCTLFDAIAAANKDAAVGGCTPGQLADTLRLTRAFYPVVADTAHYTAADGYTGLPAVTSAITVDGNPDAKGNNAVVYRVPGTVDPYIGSDRFRIFRIAATGKLTLKRLTVQLGDVSRCSLCTAGHEGGAFINYGSVTLINARLRANSADYGGGFYNLGTVIVTNSHITGNVAISGGGFFNGSGHTVTLKNSVLEGNEAQGDIVRNSDYASVGGGFWNRGRVTATGLALQRNFARYGEGARGAGFFNAGSASVIKLIDCTVSGNSATSNAHFAEGGGFYSEGGSIALTNCTVSSNSAKLDDWFSNDVAGGGLSVNGGAVTLIHTTVSGNISESDPRAGMPSAGGLVVTNGRVVIKNSLVANSKGSADCAVYGGTVGYAGVNLIEDGSCGASSTDLILKGDPKLGSLLDNGGPTQTHALSPGSVLINKVPASACEPVDQRGVRRPQGRQCDVGAFEMVLTVPPVVQTIVTFFDQSRSSGQLVGLGSASAAGRAYRLDAVRHQLLLAGDLLQRSAPVSSICQQLAQTIDRVDDDNRVEKDDYVGGVAGSGLVTMIADLRSANQCR